MARIKYISNACDRCQLKKIRCFGGNPCKNCNKHKTNCIYIPHRKRGPKKTLKDYIQIDNILN
jgi:hypothetical protein